MLSFNPSTPVKIFSKDLNDGGEIWGVEVRNQITNNLGNIIQIYFIQHPFPQLLCYYNYFSID